MNSSDINYQIDEINKKKSSPKYELPFIKLTINGRKNESTQIIKKVKNSKKIINNQVDQLLLKGFNGTLDDFYKVYGKKKSYNKKKTIKKFKYFDTLLFKSDVLAGPIKKTKIKEFNFMSKNKNKNVINEYKYKKSKNNNFEEIKSKSDIGLKNLSVQSSYYKNNSQNNTKYFSKESIINLQKEKLERINNIRKILCQKSRNISIDEDKSFHKSSIKDISIKDDEESKTTKIEDFPTPIQILKKQNFLRKGNSKKINTIFKKYFKVKNEDTKLKSILDPLRTGFKSNLKEVLKYEGKEKKNICMKKTTANIIAFGNAFQIIDDDAFYKDHKRIISVYPAIEKEANLLVPINKKRDERLINKLENNERKIRLIVHDNSELLKILSSKVRTMKASKSQITFFKKKV